MESDDGSMDVDFVQVPLPAFHAYYLVPGQIHHNIKTNDSNTWYISVNTSLVPKNYREVFEGNLLLQQTHLLEPALFKQFQNTINLLNDQFRGDQNSPFITS